MRCKDYGKYTLNSTSYPVSGLRHNYNGLILHAGSTEAMVYPCLLQHSANALLPGDGVPHH